MRTLLIAAFGLLALTCAPAHGQFSIDFYTIDGGGGTSSGGTYTLSGTIGQPDAGTVALANGTYELRGGFWHGTGSPPCTADWNGDGLVNTSDFLAYLNDYNAVVGGGVPVFGDPDLAPPFGVINTSDFLAFLNAFTGGCP